MPDLQVPRSQWVPVAAVDLSLEIRQRRTQLQALLQMLQQSLQHEATGQPQMDDWGAVEINPHEKCRENHGKKRPKNPHDHENWRYNDITVIITTISWDCSIIAGTARPSTHQWKLWKVTVPLLFLEAKQPK